MPRFFVNEDQVNLEKELISITGDDAHHISYSLRMATGDSIVLCVNGGKAYDCSLETIKSDYVEAKIIREVIHHTESPIQIGLYMAYPKGDKLETIIQKSVELGVHSITPFESAHCIKRPPKERQPKILERQKRIAEEAAKQCGRELIPQMNLPLSFKEVLDECSSYDLVLFCYEGENTDSLKTILQNHSSAKSIAVIIGSEGGFSRDEANMAYEHHFALTNLGPRILRCETAPDYVLSALSYFFEL